ncbi:MAG TPA: PspC domain-containing protein [Allosphingosinicella sp.]|jgi:phage shock protein PspC (stress-responsive transcriptional regulator)|nr:PspC domain-containing protein [Allosphingosinicella sp.]
MMLAGSILARDDTLLGVCAALGEDFGFSPTLLRMLFAMALFWSPEAALAGYALAGAAVALSRWLVPEPAAAEPEQPGAGEASDDLQEQAEAWEELALAA